MRQPDVRPYLCKAWWLYFLSDSLFFWYTVTLFIYRYFNRKIRKQLEMNLFQRSWDFANASCWVLAHCDSVVLTDVVCSPGRYKFPLTILWVESVLPFPSISPTLASFYVCFSLRQISHSASNSTPLPKAKHRYQNFACSHSHCCVAHRSLIHCLGFITQTTNSLFVFLSLFLKSR